MRRLLLIGMLSCLPASLLAAVQAWYFHAPGCRMCTAVTDLVVELEERHGEDLHVAHLPTTDARTVQRLFSMLGERGWDPDAPVPPLILIVDDRVLAGAEDIIEAAPAVVAAAVARTPKGSLPPTGSQAPHTARGPGLSLLAITLAALADGINPCVFAGVVFLISLLGLAGSSSRRVLAVGGAFALGVFAAYLALGLALRAMLVHLSAYRVAADVIYLAAWLLCLAAATVALWDALQALRGRPARAMVGRLPEAMRRRVHTVLRRAVQARWWLPAAAITGALVAMLEAACTGQVYVPVIAALVHEEPLSGSLLLLWYNMVFILPLVVIVLSTAAGLRSGALVRFGQAHWGWLKAALGMALLLLAWWMWPHLRWPPGG